MTTAIATQQLTKVYGRKTAVNAIDWNVPEGSICGLLGSNGAGKTTVLKMLLGMTHITSGEARVCELDCRTQSDNVRKVAAFVPEDKALYDHLTGNQFLHMYGSFFPDYSQEESQRLIWRWRVPAEERIRTMSRGMRGLLTLAAVLSRNPRVLVLDEPGEGLDPAITEDFLQILTEWVAEPGRTAIIATHRLSEVERVCDRILLMDNGTSVLGGELDDLRQSWKRIDSTVAAESLPDVKNWPEVQSARTRAGRIEIITKSSPQTVLERLRKLPGGHPSDVSAMNLREIYLAAVRKGDDK